MTAAGPSSSLRDRPLAATLAIARELAVTVGITRVTDTTHLDRFGVPVFASIRPTATRGALCVNAGKGMTADEAEAGAYMESIELAYAEPDRCLLPRRLIPARELGRTGAAEFIPVRAIEPETLVVAMEATDIVTGEREWVPAERVLFPLLHETGGGLFGSDGNGICSGNTAAEATLHGLAEVLERDVTSVVRSLERHTSRILASTLPSHLAALVERSAARAGELQIRYAPNAFGLPYFVAGIIDDRDGFAHRGDGCHPIAAIAATRAACEAFQSRLTDIHGGRDDLTFHRGRGRDETLERAQQRFTLGLRAGAAIDFATVPDYPGLDIASATQLLVERARAAGLTRVLRVDLAPTGCPIAIQRVLVPGAELCTGLVQRVGPRLRAALERM